MSSSAAISLRAVVLGAPDPRTLAAFYRELLGFETADEDPSWVRLVPPGGGTCLSFQLEADFIPPSWPEEPGKQQMMMHLDIMVDDLEAAGARAVELGARLSEFQPQHDVQVYFDPAGHPFCLFLPGA
jgi:catechol 2,3-dioxygenase-like lactoylglutathione lyase family enzyme